MLELSRVNSAYGRAHILYDLSLSAKRGEVVVLLGRNGAGKSTTLKTVIGLVRPLAGEISFDGRRIEQLEPYQIARLGLGYVPEDRRIFTDLSVMENLEVGRQARRSGRRRSCSSCSRTWPTCASGPARACRAANSRCSPSRAR